MQTSPDLPPAGTLPPVHISIVAPPGYVHWMALLDPARYFRWQLRRLGAEVTMAKNRLRHDALNLVFGAHLGFDPALRQRHTCLFVNLEQLGRDGAAVPAAYLKLLASSGVVDYDPANVGHYARDPQDVPVVPMLYAPYLAAAGPLPLAERPIDLLFIGSMNERRAQWLQRIESTGRQVTMFDAPLYGEDRDHFIRQAKAVLNVHFYDSCRFEQARAAHCLSLGTPVISERTEASGPHPAFEDSVLWLQGGELEQFFEHDFDTPEWHALSATALQRFTAHDPVAAYAELAAFAAGYAQAHRSFVAAGPWRPTRLNLGSGRDYRSGWLNVDIDPAAEPDLLLDLSHPLALPAQLSSHTAGPVMLDEGQFERIDASHVLQCVADLAPLLDSLLRLLQEGGELHVEVPLDGAPTAWQDPRHLRAINEQTWRYVSEWFWSQGWLDHRFEVLGCTALDAQQRPCARDAGTATLLHVLLRKVATSPQERMVALTLQPGIRLPDDDAPRWVPAAHNAGEVADHAAPAATAATAPMTAAPTAAITAAA